ncbi:MAG: BON domain-containing protein [Deltaproteobacteria bacterium]|nr:BON domain-containing protein [Deltaproteobacteria bacterium]MBW2363410.1 BON domain-containing protein [Deltaproteobacteria bacterium]
MLCIAVFLLTLPTGCTFLAIGGAAAGGYYVGTDERPVGEMVDDASITASVKTKLARDAEIKALDINVDTYRGVVTLHGHVSSAGAQGRAATLTRSVKGVREVRSRLAVVR